jgi:hypothetical protein
MNGETSREEKTPNPSSSTPASPPTDKLEPEKECLKRIADFVWGFRVVGIDGQEVKDRGNFMLGVACGQLLDFEDNEEAVKAIQAYAASVRAARTGTGSRIEELESACALLRAQIERAEKVLNKPAPPVASRKGKEEE